MNTVATARKSANITLKPELLSLAKQFDINLSQAAEAGIARAVVHRRAEKWLEANRAALDSANEFAEKHGLPLVKFLSF